MTTEQPVWKYVGHVGDVDPVSYGGGLVFVDTTGVYAPEMVYFEPASDDEWKDKGDAAELTVYRFPLDPPRFKTLTETGKQTHMFARELPASERGKTWEWYNEWFVRDLASVAESAGQSWLALARALMSKNAMQRAWAYETLLQYHGAHEFDSYHITMSETEARERWSAELAQTRA